MITVGGGVQIEGLGRCFAQTVEHNRIYLSCPTVKGTFCYDVNSGALTELWGTYRNSMPTVLAIRTNDHEVQLRDFHPGDATIWQLEHEGWSNDLAKSCYPTELTAITELILNPKKSAEDVEHSMVEFVKVKVKKLSSTGAYRFTINDEAVDFERCLNEICSVIQARNGITYNFNREVVLDYFSSVAHDIFKEK
jgi:hypothetical protein